MRKVLPVLLGLIIFNFGCNQPKNDPKKVQPDSTKAITAVLIVDGMSCTGCENTISSAVMQLGGVIEVRANHQSGSVEVTFDTTQVDLKSISEAITDKGYTVKGKEVQPQP